MSNSGKHFWKSLLEYKKPCLEPVKTTPASKVDPPYPSRMDPPETVMESMCAWYDKSRPMETTRLLTILESAALVQSGT